MRKLIFIFAVVCVTSLKAQNESYQYLFDLHGQKRVISFSFQTLSDQIQIFWKLRHDSGAYLVSKSAIERASGMSFVRGETGKSISLEPDETLFLLISKEAVQELIATGRFVYNQTTYVSLGEESFAIGDTVFQVIHARAQVDETELWIVKNPERLLIARLEKNPLGINYILKEIIDYD